MENKENKTSGGKTTFLIILALAILVGVSYYAYDCLFKPSNNNEIKKKASKLTSEYRITGNSLEKFDLSFLNLENEEKNKIYSPLSIKYALEMLAEGSNGDSKNQIDSIIGDYKAKKYVNSSNMSFANAMFIRNDFKDSVNKSYTDTLSNKYNAEIIYDSFENANTMNSWVSEKTFNLINNLFDDNKVKDEDYILTNALAIDMEWKNLIQATNNNFKNQYSVKYSHEDYGAFIPVIEEDNYSSLKFNNDKINAKAVEIGASINNYDIVTTLGEDNIRKTVGEEYQKWLNSEEAKSLEQYAPELVEKNVDTYLNTYIQELDSNYKKVDSSTDFLLYVDDNVKAFAKDLKEYDGTTLQYIGIMPTNTNLSEYIKNIDADKINNIINNLKEIKSENFKEGVVTKITGFIPLFKFDYELNLKEDLNKLGITDVFDEKKADLSGITSNTKAFISDASHKANIEFSNEGIKAAAAVQMGGWGAAGGGFEYLYDIPVEEINLTFDNPYLFLIRDKDTGEVWFTGTVYEPIEN